MNLSSVTYTRNVRVGVASGRPSCLVGWPLVFSSNFHIKKNKEKKTHKNKKPANPSRVFCPWSVSLPWAHQPRLSRARWARGPCCAGLQAGLGLLVLPDPLPRVPGSCIPPLGQERVLPRLRALMGELRSPLSVQGCGGGGGGGGLDLAWDRLAGAGLPSWQPAGQPAPGRALPQLSEDFCQEPWGHPSRCGVSVGEFAQISASPFSEILPRAGPLHTPSRARGAGAAAGGNPRVPPLRLRRLHHRREGSARPSWRGSLLPKLCRLLLQPCRSVDNSAGELK